MSYDPESNESHAAQFAKDPAKVEYRLRQAARLLLNKQLRKTFEHTHTRYHADKHMLINSADTYGLLWLPRAAPGLPWCTLGNEQRPDGHVVLVKIGAFEVNPNPPL